MKYFGMLVFMSCHYWKSSESVEQPESVVGSEGQNCSKVANGQFYIYMSLKNRAEILKIFSTYYFNVNSVLSVLTLVDSIGRFSFQPLEIQLSSFYSM